MVIKNWWNSKTRSLARVTIERMRSRLKTTKMSFRRASGSSLDTGWSGWRRSSARFVLNGVSSGGPARACWCSGLVRLGGDHKGHTLNMLVGYQPCYKTRTSELDNSTNHGLFSMVCPMPVFLQFSLSTDSAYGNYSIDLLERFYAPTHLEKIPTFFCCLQFFYQNGLCQKQNKKDCAIEKTV